MIKTCKEWHGDLKEYLKSGDEIDAEMYDYFLEILPPIWSKESGMPKENVEIINRTFNLDIKEMCQVDEPCHHINGVPTYTTGVITKDNRYYYIGEQFKLTKKIAYLVAPDGVIRYPNVSNKSEFVGQFKQFSQQASEGKVLCISDLLGNAGV